MHHREANHPMATLRTFLVPLLLLFSCCISASLNAQYQRSRQTKTCKFPAIFNFGDSNSDTGGISAVFYPIVAPYGQTFFKKAVGRASDGRLMVDFFAAGLGLPYLSAYLNSVGANYHHGANFATGSSTIMMPNETFFQGGRSPFNLQIQIAQFIQFKSRVLDPDNVNTSRVPKPWTFQKAIYTIDIGQNDIADALYKTTHDQALAAIPAMIEQVATAIRILHYQGGKAFWVHNTGPIGCLPFTLTYVSNPPPQGYHENLSCGMFLSTAGFGPPERICCGYFKDGVRIRCANREIVNGTEIFGKSCSNPFAFISWDGVQGDVLQERP